MQEAARSRKIRATRPDNPKFEEIRRQIAEERKTLDEKVWGMMSDEDFKAVTQDWTDHMQLVTAKEVSTRMYLSTLQQQIDGGGMADLDPTDLWRQNRD